MLDPVLLLGFCLLAGGTWVAAPLPLTAGTLLIVGLVPLALSRKLGLLVALCLCGSAVRAQVSVSDYRAYHTFVLQRMTKPERCFVAGTVLTSPTMRDGITTFRARVAHGECENFELRAGEIVRLSGKASVNRSDAFEATADLSALALWRNFELPDPTLRAARDGFALRGSLLSLDRVSEGWGLRSAIDRARTHARERIEATFAPQAVAMAKALVLGENDLEPEDSDAFKASGLSHMLAVSGTHLVFAILSLVSGLRALLARVERLARSVDVGRVAALFGAALALIYADFAGGSGSAWRAAWMLSAALGLRALDRERNTQRAIGASLIVGWLNDGLCVLDVSFMLSLAATLGLVTLGRLAGRRIASLGLTRPFRLLLEGLATTLSAMLPCTLLLATLSPTLSLLGIAANVVAAPFGETIALPLCLLHPLCTWLPPLEIGLARVASGALLVVRRVALIVGNSGWLQLPVPYPTDWQIAVGIVTAIALAQFKVTSARWQMPRWVIGMGALLAWSTLEMAARRAGCPSGKLRVTVLDVGQGDSTLVDLPDGKSMLIDGGGGAGPGSDPGAKVILPLLRARRRERIDLVVLSHPHPDHFGGLVAVLSNLKVGELWDTGQGEQEGALPGYSQLLALARDHQVKIERPDTLCGRRAFGGVDFAVLAPCPGFTPQANANDNSLVLRLGFGARSALFVGDAEAAEEQQLLVAHRPELSADVLKVGHHGSRTSSSPEFLRAVSPALATVSCGQGNRYGHPHAAALNNLVVAGVPTLRTDLRGSVLWSTDGHGLTLATFQK